MIHLAERATKLTLVGIRAAVGEHRTANVFSRLSWHKPEVAIRKPMSVIKRVLALVIVLAFINSEVLAKQPI
jgi:hypothetical protein